MRDTAAWNKLADCLCLQRFKYKTAGVGAPRVEGILWVCGEKGNVGIWPNLQELLAQVEPVGPTHLDVQKRQHDRVALKIAHSLCRACETNDVRAWKCLPQNGNTCLEGNGAVVHQQDIRNIVGLVCSRE